MGLEDVTGLLRKLLREPEFGPGTPLNRLSLKNYVGYVDFELQQLSERQLACPPSSRQQLPYLDAHVR